MTVLKAIRLIAVSVPCLFILLLFILLFLEEGSFLNRMGGQSPYDYYHSLRVFTIQLLVFSFPSILICLCLIIAGFFIPEIKARMSLIIIFLFSTALYFSITYFDIFGIYTWLMGD